MKAWLAKYAPKVTTSNLYDWMAIAEGVQNHFRLDATIDLRALMNSSEEELKPKLAKTADRIRKYLAGKSRTQLQLAFGKGQGGDNAPRDADGKRIVVNPTPEEALAKLTGEARDHAQTIVDSDFSLKQLWRLLSDDEIRGMLAVYEQDLKAMHQWLATPQGARCAFTLDQL